LDPDPLPIDPQHNCRHRFSRAITRPASETHNPELVIRNEMKDPLF
jgi:hypothetical protein